MSKELIKYLRDWDDIPDKDDEAFNWHRELTDKAADTIERLERENQEINAARIYLIEKGARLLREPETEWVLLFCNQVAELEKQRDNFYMDYRMKCDEETKRLHELLAEVTKQRDALLVALNRLYVACPTSLECRHFHHSKREQHSFLEQCGPADEYLEALNQTRNAIASVRGAQ